MTQVLFQKKIPSITVKSTGGIFTQGSTQTTLVNQGSQNQLEGLSDIVVDSSANGAVLMYDSGDDKYHIRQFNLDNYNLDGGSF